MNFNARHIPLRIIKVVAIVITVLLSLAFLHSAYGGYTDPADNKYRAIAVLAFPYMLGVNAMVALAWLIIKRWRIALIPIIAIICAWPSVKVVCPLNISSHTYTAQEDSTKFKLLTFNVENFGSLTSEDKSVEAKRALETARYILDQDADVVMLQEASLHADYNNLPLLAPVIREIKKKYPYRDHGYHDQVIWSKHPYTYVVDDSIKNGFASPDDPLGSYHFCARAFDVQVPGHMVRIFNLHLESMALSTDDRAEYVQLTKMKGVSNEDHLKSVGKSIVSKLGAAFAIHAEQARIIRQVIDQGDENVIVCGDFNDVPCSYAYRTILGNDMHDAWTECGFGPTTTYNQSRIFLKIDHVLYRGDMRAAETHRDKEGGSDHYPLVTTFVWKQ